MLNNIKFGIKISIQNFDFLPDIYSNQNFCDFIEIILTPEFTTDDINRIQNFKLPYAIHIPNSNYGVDFGDIKKNVNNIDFINKINLFKNDLNPLCYIVHPESGDIKLSIENIKKLDVKPIALENMPFKSLLGGELLGSDPEGLMEYFNRIVGLEFCFDLNHAIKAAISKKVDYLDFIEKFLKFRKPILFHISGGNLDIEVDEHLHLDEGQYNLSEIKKILLNYNSVVNLTFETPRNYKRRIKDDIKNIKIFIKS